MEKIRILLRGQSSGRQEEQWESFKEGTVSAEGYCRDNEKDREGEGGGILHR